MIHIRSNPFRKVERKTKLLIFLSTFITYFVFLRIFPQTQRSEMKFDIRTQEKSSQRPHILLIVADDYGWNDVGYHGSEIKTPNIDRLAAEGVKLENYYVQPTCTPTRSQLMTGRYQIHTGLQHQYIMPTQPNGLPLHIPTIADKLKEAGYATHMVGKWHLGFFKKEYTPIYRGFNSFFGYLLGSHYHYTHRNSEGLDLRSNMEVANNYTGEYSTHLFTKKAEEIVANHDNSKPLFLYLSYQAVHFPLEVPSEYKKPYDNISRKGRRIYAGMTSCMDEGVANITDAFKEYRLWDNTILIFTSDNGGEVGHGASNYPLLGSKATLWEGGIRAVGFVSSPLLENKGTISTELIHVSDWFPTLLHLAKFEGHVDGLDGFNQWRTISNRESSAREEILINIDPLAVLKGMHLFPHLFNTRVRAAIRHGDWKLITGNPGISVKSSPPGEEKELVYPLQDEDKNLWLFNIKNDPREENDLSQSHPDMVQILLERLLYYNSTAVPVNYPPCDPKGDPALHGNIWIPWQD